MKFSVHHPGKLTLGDRVFRCALGRGGIGDKTGEGDGITPVGIFTLKAVYFRPDRMSAPKTALPVIALTPADGWCDDPDLPDYNRPIKIPFGGGHEKMWREDALYNLIITLGYNDKPIIPGKGSAIFMHIARHEYDPTEGCIALETGDLLEILECCSVDTQVEIIRPQF